MELWTEYEGRTIDEVFPLSKLLRPEGRSAFFLTSNGTGVPRVIRLVEPHFDEEEILARWRGVTALNHPNLLKLEKFGQVTLDGAAVLYAVMEPVDANLGEVLDQQRLSLDDAKQLAESLISALNSLHSHGYVHEHIEPAHIYAVGETVKLRSDCVREAPEGKEGDELKRRDLHDFAVVVLQALTQKKTLEAASRDLPLPAPFDQIVRKGTSGEWGTAEITAALKPAAAPKELPRMAAPAAKPVPPVAPAAAAAKPAKTELPAARAAPSAADRFSPLSEDHPRPARRGVMLATLAVIVVVLILLVWHFMSGRSPNQSTAQPPTPSSAVQNAPAPDKPTPSAPPVSASTPQNPRPADARDQWRVIAYTYNHEDQAAHKVTVVAQAHPDLRPEVFSPTGRAPYLVAIGEFMSREDAFALAQKARNEGLPRDTYAQNYTGKSR